MQRGPLHLLGSRRFLPLFLTQALGAFNDNVLKNALVILITYRLAGQAGVDAGLLVTLAAGIFILPFFLFSATAGQLADRCDKALLIRRVKLAEVLLMLMASTGFWLQSTWMLMLVLFLMGTQSAFFGPLKYGILPDHLQEGELVGANGLLQASTFLAILLGTLSGGLLVLVEHGTAIISLFIVAIALLGWFCSRYIPATGIADPGLRIGLHFLRDTWRIVVYSRRQPAIFAPLLGVSWFWLVGATFLAQMPTFGKQTLHGDEGVVTLLLLLFSMGIGIGSLLCDRLLKGEVKASLVPVGALGISLFTFDLYFASKGLAAPWGKTLIDVPTLLSDPAGWRLLLDFILIAASGGIYVVPLNAIIQARSEPSHRARNIATVNIFNAMFMVASALASLALLAAGMSVAGLLLTLALFNLGAIPLVMRIR